jgi:hypothetical protein
MENADLKIWYCWLVKCNNHGEKYQINVEKDITVYKFFEPLKIILLTMKMI